MPAFAGMTTDLAKADKSFHAGRGFSGVVAMRRAAVTGTGRFNSVTPGERGATRGPFSPALDARFRGHDDGPGQG